MVFRIFLSGFYLVVFSTFAHSQVSKCNCDTIVSGCSASIAFDKEKSLATVSASTDQCAKVTFDVDNTPYISVFNGGEAVENIMVFDKKKKVIISVRQCQVCKYEGDDNAKEGDDQGAAKSATLEGSWSAEGDRIVFKGGNVFLNGSAIGNYHGTTAHTRVDHGAEQPQPTVCDASLADENSVVFVCSGGGTLRPFRFTAVRQ
uniref:Orf27 n=1 Tax=Mesorhizobium sp. CJ1 TaxID=447687 RepID=A6N7X4_9HYPH|nr:Orf27 [Mesorhizobium sp. CJ1]